MSSPVPPSQQVVSALVVQQCLRLAKSRGIPTDRFLKGAGISREQLAVGHLQLPWLPVEQQLHVALEEMDDPLLGLHISALINMASLGVLGYVVQTSSTLRNLIDTIIQFDTLLSNLGRTWRGQEGNTALWGWDCHIGDALVARHAVDCVLGCWASLLANLLRKRTSSPLLGVQLQHSGPRDPQHLREYEAHFGCPIQFNQPRSALLLVPETLESTLSLADPTLHSALEEHARLILNKRTATGGVALLDQVRGAVRGQLARHVTPTREDVAEELGMSGRTLHRKLQDAGTSFRDILDALRFELAQDYLREPALTVEAVAQQLGFQESQSFIRWFRQLAGTTPGDFRQQAQKAAPPG
ncbi:MAG: transcriptional regulator, AraC family [Moraxellaceae bacterium]|jgi:AraC-like DNA-binding protein|nr:transcriptional regulator, AraC family [Moraxellaceae bacterium]